MKKQPSKKSNKLFSFWAREWWADETYYWTKYIVYDGFVRDNDCILLTPKPIIMDIKGELPSHLTKSYRNNQIKE